MAGYFEDQRQDLKLGLDAGGRARYVFAAENNPKTLIGYDGDDFLFGGSKADTITANAGKDYIEGGGGDDSVEAGNGVDEVHGGAGNDSVQGGGGEDLVVGGKGSDDRGLRGGGESDHIWGDEQQDTARYAGANYGGNDNLYGEGGKDFLYGGGGNDRLEGGAEADFLYGDGMDPDDATRTGTDVLVGGSGADFLNGGHGADFLYGDAEAADDRSGSSKDSDTINGGQGGDFIYGGMGADIVDGGDHGDLIVGGGGSDSRLFGGKGDDIIYGDAQFVDDVSFAFDRDDKLFGGDDNDKLYGGAGRDILDGGRGNDELRGGRDADMYMFWTSDGNGEDKIIDDPRTSRIFVDGQLVAGVLFQDGGNNTWKFPGATATLTHNSPYSLHFGGLSIELGEAFESNDFGLRLFYSEGLAPPVAAVTILGDLEPADQNPNMPGIQPGNDQYFNILVGGNAQPNRPDSIHDNPGNTRVISGGGNDHVEFYSTGPAGSNPGGDEGGNDWIELGEGNDVGQGGEGNDYIVGEGGTDHIWGGPGKDILFGDASGSIDQAIIDPNC